MNKPRFKKSAEQNRVTVLAWRQRQRAGGFIGPCDCGAAADKRDGSGLSCGACRAMIERVTQMIERVIRRMRSEENKFESEDNRREWYRDYHQKNRAKIARYNADYCKQRREKGPKANEQFNAFTGASTI
jgi:hypothetical protein